MAAPAMKWSEPVPTFMRGDRVFYNGREFEVVRPLYHGTVLAVHRVDPDGVAVGEQLYIQAVYARKTSGT